jgi:tetratricopeptide (TPR) repeat protein
MTGVELGENITWYLTCMEQGELLAAQGRWADAAGWFGDAVAADPLSAEAHNNLGSALGRQKQFDRAARHFLHAVGLRPTEAWLWANLGMVYMDLADFTRAEEAFREAVARQRDNAKAHLGLGHAHAEFCRFDEALAAYERALEIDPDYADAHFSRALVLLALQRYREGWQEFEWRWRITGAAPRLLDRPMWDGSPLAGRTILLWGEQGHGDQIQFLRYVPLVQQMGGKVIVECKRPLVPLAEHIAETVVARGDDLPHYDTQCPFMSLPLLLNMRSLADIPPAPYLPVPLAGTSASEIQEDWRQRIRGPGLKVGLNWQGSTDHPELDQLRSVPFQALAPLLNVPGVSFYSVQFGPARAQLTSNVTDLGKDFDPSSFTDLAGALANLDLLITVDSAPAHLAGALGVPVWIALPKRPDWRWLLHGPTSPWYPTARLFRQHHIKEWGPVFSEMAAALERVAKGG